MIDDLQVGQVLWLKVRYQIDKIAQVKHPMLVADIQDDYIEIIALDKTAGKLQNLYYHYNWYGIGYNVLIDLFQRCDFSD